MISANTINFKNIADDFYALSQKHKFINSFGLGDVDQISFYTTQRLAESNPTDESPFFPLMFVVPGQVQNALRYKTWDFNTLMMDIVERDLSNQVDILSDTLQTLQDEIGRAHV